MTLPTQVTYLNQGLLPLLSEVAIVRECEGTAEGFALNFSSGAIT